MSKVDLTQVDVRLAVTDSPVGRLPHKIRCREPSHKDREESMAVYADGIQCFGCGKVVKRRMESLAYLLYGDETKWYEAIAKATAYTFRSIDAYRERVGQEARRDPLPNSLAKIYHEYLYGGRSHRLEWLHNRGLQRDTIEDFNLGHDGTKFTIPVYDACGRLITIRFRRDDYYGKENALGKPIPKYSGMQGRNGEYLFPEDKIAAADPGILFLFEGELDTILAWQRGYSAVTITNGAGQMKKIPKLVKEKFSLVDKLCIVGDMDEPGRVAAKEAEEAARDEGFVVLNVEWNIADGKDLTEYISNGNKFSI